MKLLNIIAVLLTCFAMQGCGKFSDGTSVFAEWGWVVPTLPAIGAVIFLIRSIMASKSGTTQQTMTGGTKDVPGNVPFYKVNSFKYAVVLAIVSLLIVIAFNLAK